MKGIRNRKLYDPKSVIKISKRIIQAQNKKPPVTAAVNKEAYLIKPKYQSIILLPNMKAVMIPTAR